MDVADLPDVDTEAFSSSERNCDEYSSNDEGTDTRKRSHDSRNSTDQSGPTST